MGRRDYSRSPPRHDFYDDPRERSNNRSQRDMHSDKEQEDGYRDGDDSYSKRDGGPRSSRHHEWEDDRGGMYDDDYHRGRYDDDRRSDGQSNHRGRRGYESRSPGGGYRGSRSRSHSPRRDAGKPSDTVILEGLPFNISTSELRESILNSTIAIEFPSIDIRISSSRGHCRAFVQFEEIDHAIAFVKQYFPQLTLRLSHSTDDVPDGKFSAYIHYARPREDLDTRVSNSGNWTCATCDFSNYASRSKCKVCGSAVSASSTQQSLSGAADAYDGPSQILVIHPLPPFVNEDMLASDIKRLELEKPDPSKDTSKGAPKLKSTAPTGDASGYGARPGSLHRVFLMRDPKTNESVKYGFAEFWTLEDAVAAMAKFKMSRSFTVAACTVTISHIHMGVFIPEERDVGPTIERLSFNPLFNPTLRVKYRDPRAYPSQKIVATNPPTGDDAGAKEDDLNSDAKKSKKRKAESNLAAAAGRSVNMAGHMALWQRKHDEIHGEAGPKKEGSHGIALSSANQVPLSSGPTLKSDPKAPIKISLSGSTLVATSTKPEAPPVKTTDGDSSKPIAQQQQPQPNDEPAVSYVDRERLMCLICMRKYKSVDEVNIHEKSRNHKTAMENDELIKAALPRLAARDKRLQKQAEEDGDASSTGPQYRDRAKERRQAYNQPKKPSAPPQADKPKPEVAKPQKEEAKAAPAKPAASKGAGMLAKMGWTSGSGLGANGDGRTDVIVTNAYQEGVGLGAEGSNLGDAAEMAEKKTRNSYAEYVNSVQDKARERYNRLG
ncbi:RNA-binding 5-A-like protein [Cladobotryum mycophilum]|uniref:RNA-binding 5-A-like protein n=1 Tax=Cladobotryum mycophilum TaxID=491253 RepID=A0ABR0SG17_9HYPO